MEAAIGFEDAKFFNGNPKDVRDLLSTCGGGIVAMLEKLAATAYSGHEGWVYLPDLYKFIKQNSRAGSFLKVDLEAAQAAGVVCMEKFEQKDYVAPARYVSAHMVGTCVVRVRSKV